MSLKSHSNALPEGYRLHGFYRIGGILGQGGFGITYEALDTNLDRLVAIKEYLPKEFAVREQSSTVRPFTEDRAELFRWGLDRFIQEARTLAKFEHPNIVHVYSVFEENGTAYMVMHYEQGEDLDSLLKFGRIEKEADLLRIAYPLLDGLEHMHEAGFIHRDVKPANIYVRRDGSPVLLDFGSARFAVGEETKTLTSLVSPGFAPYEQYHAEKGTQGPWTDIYGLAATLYAGLERGRGPIDAIVRGKARIEGEPDPMEPAAEIGNGRYSEGFLNAIDAALGFTADERPQTVSDWRTMFPAMDGPAAQARTTSTHAPATQPKAAPTEVEAPTQARVTSTSESAPTEIEAPTPAFSAIRVPGGDNSTAWIAGGIILAIAAVWALWTMLWQPKRPSETEQAELLVRAPAPRARSEETTAEETKHANEANRLRPPDGAPFLPAAETETKAASGAMNDRSGRELAATRQPPLAEAEPDSKHPGSAFQDTLEDGSMGPEMVVIPAGSFRMGDIQGHGAADEKPVHTVRIGKAFAMGKYEVTFDEYDRFAAATGRKKPFDRGWGRGRRPVIWVSWDDATAYTQWLSAQTGRRYRLPSESEWEYAARAGTDSRYPWGSDIGRNRAACDGCGSRWDDKHTAPVGSFGANLFGLHDTVGNVWEWTQDCWYSSYDGAPMDGSAWATGTCGEHVGRGGSWSDLPRDVRSANRYAAPTVGRLFNLGFRLAREL